MTATTLVLPFKAPNLNDLMRSRGGKHAGFRLYNAEKKAWAERVRLYCLEQSIPVGPFHDGVHLGFLIVEENKRRDPGNFTAGTEKLVVDGLVRCGVLRGDGWSGVLSLSYAWEVGEPAIVVTLSKEPLMVRKLRMHG